MLIEAYFQKIESEIEACPYTVETEIRKEKRSFYIAIVEGRMLFTEGVILDSNSNEPIFNS